jgi:hypothetical protein
LPADSHFSVSNKQKVKQCPMLSMICSVEVINPT